MKNKTNISIDLETLGTNYDSYILSIGAAKFDIESGIIAGTFNIFVKCDNGFKIDTSTVMWWLGQSDAARKQIIDGDECSFKIGVGLNMLQTFINNGDLVWGNGSTFDITILEHAYDKCGLETPWKFWDVRDMRTIVDVAKDLNRFDPKSVARTGTHHSALDDAIHQAKVISAAYIELGVPF